jgi:hypothetical protein
VESWAVEGDPKSYPWQHLEGDEMTGDKYKVVTTFCDDVVLDHDHEDLKEAAEEYTSQLAQAIEPSMEHPEARHVRRVEFYAMNETNEQDQFCFAGPFECEDRTKVTL